MSETLPRLISQLAFFSNTDEKETLILRRLPSDVLHPAVRSIELEDAYWRELCTKITGKLFPHLSSTAGQVLNVILSSNVLIPSLDLACSERITLKVLISIHSLIVKQMAQTIFSTKSNKIWTRSHRLNILLYEFGQRRREFDGKSLFAISNRSLIDDQGTLSNEKSGLITFRCSVQLQKMATVKWVCTAAKLRSCIRRFQSSIFCQSRAHTKWNWCLSPRIEPNYWWLFHSRVLVQNSGQK